MKMFGLLMLRLEIWVCVVYFLPSTNRIPYSYRIYVTKYVFNSRKQQHWPYYWFLFSLKLIYINIFVYYNTTNRLHFLAMIEKILRLLHDYVILVNRLLCFLNQYRGNTSVFSGTKIPWKLCVTTPSARNWILDISEKFSASTTTTYNMKFKKEINPISKRF